MVLIQLLLVLSGEIIGKGQSFLIEPMRLLYGWNSIKARTATNPTNQDWDADQYDSHFKFVYEYGQSLLDLVNLQPGESVLDVGCGTGVLTAALATAATPAGTANGVVQAIGMDPDPNMIQEARKTFPHVDFFQGDARNFTIAQPVDVVFSNAALHWIPCCNMDQAVACMAKSLKPGGRLIVEFGGSGNVGRIVAALQEVLQERHDVTFGCPWCFPSISEFTKHMEDNGIEALSAVLFDRPTVLQGADQGLNNWLRMFAGQFVGKYLDDETLTLVNDKLRKDLYDGQKWIADYRRLRVVGRKR